MATRTLAVTALAASIIIALGCQQPAAHRTARDDAPTPLLIGPESGSAAVALAARSDAASPEAIGLLDRLSIMSFNMEHKDRPAELAIMADHLRSDVAEIPDFIILQEVMFGRSRVAGEDNTAAVLANELGYYSRGTQRSSDREGIAIISRYPFLYYASRELKHQTSRMLLGFNRVSVMGEFKVPEIGRVRVVDVHLTNWDFDARVRRDQLEETLRWAAERQEQTPADLVIFGGDFNIESNSSDLDMMYNTNLSGGVTYRGYNNPHAVTRNSKRVDYIFIATPGNRSSVAYLNEQTMWPSGLQFASGGRFHLSDHLPVLQEYRISSAVAARTAPAAVAAAQ